MGVGGWGETGRAEGKERPSFTTTGAAQGGSREPELEECSLVWEPDSYIRTGLYMNENVL